MKNSIKIAEAALVILIFLSFVGLGEYFLNLNKIYTPSENPFQGYERNPGIVKISIASAVSQFLFLGCYICLSFERNRNDIRLILLYIIAAISISFLRWYELYYGSTFYYGEVRDKQGLMFPVISSMLMALVALKCNYSRVEKRNYTIKIALALLINIGLYVLWLQVQESWQLIQS